jgi:hypothetical protein
VTTAVAVRERGLLMSGPMVRAILDDRKTKTRRVMNPQPAFFGESATWINWRHGKRVGGGKDFSAFAAHAVDRCPYGQPGDRLYVRETHLLMKETPGNYEEVMYVDHEDHDICYPTKGSKYDLGWRVCPGIHMKRIHSRLTLEITEVRVERLQEITREDAIAEGCVGWASRDFESGQSDDGQYPEEEFRDLWNNLNEKRGYGWDTNPWVWVLSFRRVV